MKFMTTTRTDRKAPITIPGNFLHTAGLGGKLRLDLHPGAVVLTSPATDQGKMDAMLSLLSIVNEMMEEIIVEHGGGPDSQEPCGDCLDCRSCCPDKDEPFFEDCEGCEHRSLCDEHVSLPLCWLEDAGIPFFGDLRAACEDGRIVITAAEDGEPEDMDGEAKQLLSLLELNGITPDRARELLA